MLRRFDWNKTKQIRRQMGRNNWKIVPFILTQCNCFWSERDGNQFSRSCVAASGSTSVDIFVFTRLFVCKLGRTKRLYDTHRWKKTWGFFSLTKFLMKLIALRRGNCCRNFGEGEDVLIEKFTNVVQSTMADLNFFQKLNGSVIHW